MMGERFWWSDEEIRIDEDIHLFRLIIGPGGLILRIPRLLHACAHLDSGGTVMWQLLTRQK